MNPDDQIEARLRRQPLRALPTEWRAEILSVAEKARQVAPRRSWWQEMFWPHPVAWGALASVWIVIVGANFATREPERVMAHRPAPTRELREMLHEQERLLAELVGPAEKPDIDRPKPNAPRSQRRPEFFTV